MQALLDVILPVFLVIGFGYMSVWRQVFPERCRRADEIHPALCHPLPAVFGNCQA